jgi:hypothetical protein
MRNKFLHRKGPARRVLLWTVVVLLEGQLALDLLIDSRRPDLRSPHLALALAKMDACAPPVGVVCLGTSRFGGGIFEEEVQTRIQQATGDPEVVVFNASVNSADFDTSDFLLRQMLRRGWRPSLVVIELCPEMVNRRNRLFGAHVLPRLNAYTLAKYPEDVWLSKNVVRLIGERLLPIYSSRRALRTECTTALCTFLDTLSRSTTTETSTGAGARTPAGGPGRPQHTPTREQLFLDSNPDLDARQRTEENLPRVRDWLADYRLGGLSCLALERLLRRCHENRATAVLVAPPVCSAQRLLYTPEIEAAFQDYVRRLETTYPCQFVDYRDRIPDSLFYDNHHLFSSGGTIFTEALTHEVLIPSWLRIHNDRRPYDAVPENVRQETSLPGSVQFLPPLFCR